MSDVRQTPLLTLSCRSLPKNIIKRHMLICGDDIDKAKGAFTLIVGVDDKYAELIKAEPRFIADVRILYVLDP
jgi:hypothetical protein